MCTAFLLSLLFFFLPPRRVCCCLCFFSLILYHCLLEIQSNGSSNLQKCNQFTRLLLFSLSSTTTKSTWVELFAQPVLVFIALLPSCSLCTHVFQSVFYPSCYNLQFLQKKLLQIGARFSWQEKGEIGMAKGFSETLNKYGAFDLQLLNSKTSAVIGGREALLGLYGKVLTAGRLQGWFL